MTWTRIETMVTQREMNNMKRHTLELKYWWRKGATKEFNSVETGQINIFILLACKESTEEQLTNYDKQFNEWIDSLKENQENDKNIENYENFTHSGKRVMNKLKGIILGFKHHMESIEKKKRRQFEEIMRKERPESEK